MDKSSREKSWQCYSFKRDSKFVNNTKEKLRETSRRDLRPQNKKHETKRHLEGDTTKIERGVRGRLQASPKGDSSQRTNH